MGEGTTGSGPIVVEVDRDNPEKNIEALDIELPVLAKRIEREYKNLDQLQPGAMVHTKLSVKMFNAEQQREIVFKHISSDEVSHTTEMGEGFTPTPQNVIGFFANNIRRDLRLVGGFDILFGKLKEFMGQYLFETPVDLNDLNVLRNLSEPAVSGAVSRVFKKAINELTVVDRGTTRIQERIKLSRARPIVVQRQAEMIPTKSIFNRIVGDSGLELSFAKFLDGCSDIVSFAKNAQNTGFSIEYRAADGSIASYFPDFVVKKSDKEIWIVETKGREDLNDPPKWERLKTWCADASAGGDVTYRAMFVREEDFEASQAKLKDFHVAIAVFET
jgi:type III restriction enzyme